MLLEYQNIKTFLQKVTLEIGLKKSLSSKKVKNTVLWIYAINDLNGGEIVEIVYEIELQKVNHKEFRTEKVIKRKGDELYVKWKKYNNSFNSWIDKKDTV